jgi:hypothetical protein
MLDIYHEFRYNLTRTASDFIGTYVVPSITKLSMMPWAAARDAEATKTRTDLMFAFVATRLREAE